MGQIAGPHTSNVSPYGESRFRAPKYRPDLRDVFGSIEDAGAFCHRLFA